MTDHWQPVGGAGLLSERIVHQIESLVAADQLKPGDRLPAERELALLLGVSRPSLREAIRSLAVQGRVSVRHGQGVFIEDPTTKRLRSSLGTGGDVEELFAMREVLEVPGAGWAAERATPEQLDSIRMAYYELSAATTRDPVDWDELQRLDARFHESIVRAGGNRFMLRTIGVLNEIIQAGMETTLRAPGRLEASARDHAAILAALEAGDAPAARAAARKHIRGALATARRIVAQRSP
jgi:GntR family transcriptional repressor for pyruvate dehydrogenase complex